MATSLPTVTPQGISNNQPPSAVFFSLAAFMPVVAFQGAGVDVIDENNRQYLWNGSNYVLPDASVSGNTIPSAEKGVPGGVATLDVGTGTLPLVQLPSAAIREWLGVAANQTAMLALQGNKGDWCTRADDSRDYEIIGADPTQIGSWRAHSYPAAVDNSGNQVGGVTSFAGRVGAVTPQVSDLSDASAAGQALLIAADNAAQRTALGIGTAAALNVPATGNAASNEVVKGSDSRLTDSRTPSTHNQDASTINYTNASLPGITNLQAALDKLLYTPPQIIGFTNSVGAVEIGRTITSVPMSWSLNKAVTGLSLDNGIGQLTTTLTSFSHTSQSITTNRTYTLSATDGTNTVTATTSISFQSKRYWGSNAAATLTDAQILALTGQELSTVRAKSSFSVAGAGGYVYYVLPDSMGTPSFTVGGLAFSDFTLVTRAVVNASGASVTYRIYRTNSIQNGTLTMTVA